MASLYKRTRKVGGKVVLISPYWWIQYVHPSQFVKNKKGKTVRKVVHESTGFRIGVGVDTRRAEEMRARYTLQEAQGRSLDYTETWEAWVTPYLESRYGKSTSSCLRAKISWRTMKMFLDERQISTPRQLLRTHLNPDYLRWREHPDKAIGKYRACQNTARSEIKFLSVLMDEAVRRGYVQANPCLKLGIKKQPTKIKPALTPEVVKTIREKIAKEEDPDRKEFLSNSFEIAYHHGVRLSGTYLNPQKSVYRNAAGQLCITFTHKGKTRTKILHPNLVPLFEKLLADGRTETYKPQKSAAKTWWRFLTKHGIKTDLPNACFHSTRVTVATTLARKNVPKQKAMEYIDHASTLVHDIYVRLEAGDLDECLQAIE